MPEIDVSWLRNRADACRMTAQECDRRASRFGWWLTGERQWWRQEACWWRVQAADWDGLADEIAEAARLQAAAVEGADTGAV